MPGSTPTIRVNPEKFASTALRIGVNYVVYPMTH